MHLIAAAAMPAAASAQSFETRDWLVVCDNTRACRAAGYSVEGSEAPVSVMVARAPGAGRPVFAELQLAALDPRAVHPASVAMTLAGKPAGMIRVDRNNHAELPAAATAALLKALVARSDVAFVAGRTTWKLSGDGAVEALQKMDDVQGRSGRPSALVRKGGGNDADVESPMALPRFEAGFIPTAAQPGDAALVVRVMAGIPSNPGCPLLDDGAAQARARLWHLDANRLLVSQPCKAAAGDAGTGYWVANLRPPHDARPLTYAGAAWDGGATIVAREAGGPAGDCGTVQAWTWNGFRMEPSYAASGGLCRGVKAGGAWELPTLVNDVVPGR